MGLDKVKKGGLNMTDKKKIVGFEVDKEFKDRIDRACKQFKIDGVSAPVKFSMFCRIAVEKLLKEIKA